MIHMVVNTHTAESCAFRGTEEEELLTGALDRFSESAPGSGMSINGSWVNRAGHEIFMLIDASNAHAIEEALLDAGLVGRTHSRIVPVLGVQDVLESS